LSPLIPAGTTAEAPRAITAEEKAAGSQYVALRNARANQRYAGIRAERQKKKDEEEAAKKVNDPAHRGRLCRFK
jgi:large subunit ribosomal protein L13e